MYKTLLSLAVLVAVVAGASHKVSAAEVVIDENENKVAICHRDNNVKKPYGPKKIEVNKNSVDGEGQNDHTHHTGPVATSEAVAQALKDEDEKWGDIIPPFDNYPGLNWTAAGQAIWNNDCQYVTDPDVPVVPVTPVTPVVPTTPASAVISATTPQVTNVPVNGVNAGGGNGSGVPAAIATVASLTTFAFGVLRLRKFNG